MAKGIIRVNPDRSQVEIETPQGDVFGCDYPGDEEDNIIVIADDPNNAYLAVLEGGHEQLTANTLYRLTPVSTLVEEVDFDDSDDDADDEGDEEPAATEPEKA